MRVSRPQNGNRGSATIEGALVLLAFLAVLVGTADMAQLLLVHNTLVERTRNAARAAAVHDYDDAAATNLVLYGRANPPDGAGAGIFGLTSANVAVTRSDEDTTARRVVITVSGLRCRTFSPWFVSTLYNFPVRVAVSLETPE